MRAQAPWAARNLPYERGYSSNRVVTPLGYARSGAITAPMSEPITDTVVSGGYEVDIDAVAAAMLTHERIRRVASGVLVPAEPADLATICIPDDQPAAIGDAA